MYMYMWGMNEWMNEWIWIDGWWNKDLDLSNKQTKVKNLDGCAIILEV